MSNSQSTSRTRSKRPSNITIPLDKLRPGIVLYHELQECNKNLNKLSTTISSHQNRIDRLNDKILSLNEEIRKKNTLASTEHDLFESDFSKMWAMPATRRTGRGTRRGKKRKKRRSKRR